MRPLAAMLAVAALATGCGAGCPAVPPSAIAVVGGRAIPRADFDAQMAQTRRAYAAGGRAFPAQGTPAYQRLKDGAVRLLVDRARIEIEALQLGIVVGAAQVDAALRRYKQTTFGGDEARYRDRLRRTGMTDADVREAIRSELLAAAVRRAGASIHPEWIRVAYATGCAPANGG